MKLFDGAKLKQMRLDAKLTQYDLAPLTNITQTRISDIERNVRQPLPKEVDAFMAVFGKTKADFLSDEREIVVISGTFTKTKKDGKPPHPPGFLVETRPACDRGTTTGQPVEEVEQQSAPATPDIIDFKKKVGGQ